MGDISNTQFFRAVQEEKKLEAKIVEGPYIHHCAGIHGDGFARLYEACKYIGVKPDLYDDNDEEIKAYLEIYQKKYYDARHVCYAYMLGHERKDFRANDNGEPSGTAGKPILGQINSNELTDILIVVIRYFGGIKLGTSGLIVAYRAAASEAIVAATIIEKTVDEEVTVLFEYPFMNDVMRIVKEEEPEILSQSYDMDCCMTLRIRQSMMPRLRARLEKVETARIVDDRENE